MATHIACDWLKQGCMVPASYRATTMPKTDSFLLCRKHLRTLTELESKEGRMVIASPLWMEKEPAHE